MSIQDCDSVSSLIFLSSDTFEDDLTFSTTEFVYDSEVYSNFISEVDAAVHFALTLSFTRTPRLLRNAEDVIFIHKRKLLNFSRKPYNGKY